MNGPATDDQVDRRKLDAPGVGASGAGGARLGDSKEFFTLEPGWVVETGTQIRAARALLGWSQELLAERAGVHRKTVAFWESAAILCEADISYSSLSYVCLALARGGVHCFGLLPVPWTGS